MEQTHVVLLGLMGSGKSTVGRALAKRLGRPFRDSDPDIEAATGRSAHDIAEEDGIDALHVLEVRHLLDALDATEPLVIAAAAYVIEDTTVQTALSDRERMTPIWLRGDPAILARQAATGDHRPDFGPLQSTLEDQARRRDPLFEALDPITIDIGDESPEAAVDTALARLGDLGIR